MKKLIFFAVIMSLALTIQAQNKDFVDLGLPSGTLWKAKNEKGFFNQGNLDEIDFDSSIGKSDESVPSNDQWIELREECQWQWKGSGYTITGVNGNSIYLPAAGYRGCCGNTYVDFYGYYWSFSGGGFERNKEVVEYNMMLFFSADNIVFQRIDTRGNFRFSIRLVKN